MQQQTILQQDFQKAIQQGKQKFITIMNTQTLKMYQYQIQWAEHDPYDWNNPIVPQFVLNVVGNDETIFIGSIYNTDEFQLPLSPQVPNDYPAVKIFMFVFNQCRQGKLMSHIEILDGLVMTEKKHEWEPLNKSKYAEFEDQEKRLDREYRDQHRKPKKFDKNAKIISPASTQEVHALQYGPDAEVKSLSAAARQAEIADFCTKRKDKYSVIKQIFK
jgi:hypothetical protein